MPEPALLAVLASGALLVTPGPAVLYIVARSVEQGRAAGLLSVQFVDPARGVPPFQVLLFGLGFIGLGLVSDGLWALAAGTAGRWVRRDGRLRRLERYVAGGVFVGLGMSAALAGSGRK